MEQNQINSDATKFNPPPALHNYAYPLLNYDDKLASSYVHSLASTPYYYFVPNYSYASGYYYPNPHYAYNLHIGIPTMNTHNQGSSNTIANYYYASPIVQNHANYSRAQKSSDYGKRDHLEESNEHSINVQLDNEKSFDPRIVNILEPFRQLYSESEESLKTIFPRLYSKLSEFFKKVNSLILENINTEDKRSRGRTLKRSLSLGASPRCKNERFKVKPIDSENFGNFPTEDKGDDQEAI